MAKLALNSNFTELVETKTRLDSDYILAWIRLD